MTNTDGADQLDDDVHQDDEPAGAGDVVCDECGEDFTDKGRQAKMLRGLHMRRQHGVAGAGRHRRTKTPPRPPRSRVDRPAPARGGRSPSRKDLEEGTRELYESFGLIVYMRDPEAGALIIGNKRLAELAEAEATSDGIAGAAAKAWAKVAQHNDAVESLLSKTLSTGDWSEVITAHLPILMLAVKRNPEKLQATIGGWRGKLAARAAARQAARRVNAQRQQRPPPAAPRPAADAAGYAYQHPQAP